MSVHYVLGQKRPGPNFRYKLYATHLYSCGQLRVTLQLQDEICRRHAPDHADRPSQQSTLQGLWGLGPVFSASAGRRVNLLLPFLETQGGGWVFGVYKGQPAGQKHFPAHFPISSRTSRAVLSHRYLTIPNISTFMTRNIGASTCVLKYETAPKFPSPWAGPHAICIIYLQTIGICFFWVWGVPRPKPAGWTLGQLSPTHPAAAAHTSPWSTYSFQMGM